MTTPNADDGMQPNNSPGGYEPYPSSYPPPAGGMNPPPNGGVNSPPASSYYQPQPGSYPSDPYAAAGYYAPGYAASPVLNVNGYTVVQGDGQPPILGTIIGGFKGLFIRPWAFIGYSLIASIIFAAISVGELIAIGTQTVDLNVGDTVPAQVSLMMVIAVIIGAFLLTVFETILFNGALQAAEGRLVSLRDIFTPRYTFSTPILVAILVALLSGIGFFIQLPELVVMLGHLKVVDVEGAGVSFATDMKTTGMASTVAFVVHIVMWLASPLFVYAPLVALDQGTSVKESFALAFRYGRSHWFKLVAFMIALGLVMGLLSLITFGVASIVIFPAVAIAQAIMYRRISGGLHIVTD